MNRAQTVNEKKKLKNRVLGAFCVRERQKIEFQFLRFVTTSKKKKKNYAG